MLEISATCFNFRPQQQQQQQHQQQHYPPRFNRPWLSSMCDAKSEDREIRTPKLLNGIGWQARILRNISFCSFHFVIFLETLILLNTYFPNHNPNCLI
jgi:hypothetical protein